MKLKSEANIIIAIDALKKIMIIFLGLFLTAYFIKTSSESIIDLSIYYIFSYSISDGALGTLITILIFNVFKTNMNLGIISSISTVLSIITIKLYGKYSKNKSDKKALIISSIIPVISVFIVLMNTVV